MRKTAILCAVLLAVLPIPAQAKVMDAKTVREFLAACLKDQEACAAEMFEEVSRLAALEDPLVCLNQDQQEEPIIVYRAMMRYLRETPNLGRLPTADTIEHGADILYPCQGPF